MQSKLIHAAAGERVFTVILQTGDEAMASPKKFVAAENISAASITALVPFRRQV